MARKWTTKEIRYLEDHAMEGARSIGEALGRSEKSVICCASRYGISLKQRWFCPRCARYSFTPLSAHYGWCRTCCVEESHDKAALRNRELRKELEDEKRRLLEATRRRQAIYSDSNRISAKRKIVRGKWESETPGYRNDNRACFSNPSRMARLPWSYSRIR